MNCYIVYEFLAHWKLEDKKKSYSKIMELEQKNHCTNIVAVSQNLCILNEIESNVVIRLCRNKL